MQLINAPGKLVLPFANAGAKNSIPVASQIGIVAGAASLTDGFPPLTRTPLAAGGVPPSGLDMNGIIYELSAILRWANAGAGYVYDGTFATDSNVGGYPKGARVLRSDGLGYWFNTTDNNTTDPEGAGAVAAGWVPDFTNGVAAVTMTGTNVTLTALQYGKPVVVISGTLTANLNLIFPNIVGEWVVINNTTGAFTITCKTAAGTGIALSPGAVRFIVGDATNILAQTALGALIGLQIFSASGTYTPTPGISYAIVECQGGGGGGGGSSIPAAGQWSVAGGGSSGAYGVGKYTAAQIGASQTVTVGTGGNGGAAGTNGGANGLGSSFGALLSAPGGIGGAGASGQVSPWANSGGYAMTTSSGGNIKNSWGIAGEPGVIIGPSYAISGAGGGSPMCGGAGGGLRVVQQAGSNGNAPGAGGGGAYSYNNTAAFAGGNGATGRIIVWEYA